MLKLKKKDIAVLSILFIILLFLIYNINMMISPERKLIGQIPMTILNSIMIICAISCLRSKSKFIFTISTLITIIVFFDFIYIATFKSTIESGNIASFFSTNKRESFEFIISYWKPILLNLFFFVAFVYLVIKSTNNLSSSTYFSLTLICLLMVISTRGYNATKAYTLYNKDDGKSYISFPDLLLENYKNGGYSMGFRTVFVLVSEFKNHNSMSSYIVQNRETPFNRSKNNDIKHIILVIGESSLRSRYSAYGYEENTTPFLNKKKESLIHDVISPAPVTALALKQILTMSSPHYPQKWLKYKNIIELANDAGYETIWLSNNGTPLSTWDIGTTAIAKSSNKVDFKNSGEKDDLELIKELKNVINEKKYQFIILHLRGSHAAYNSKLSSDNIDKNALHKNYPGVEYDRTIHHTDRVLEQIDSIVEKNKTPSIVYYLSDHGEIVNKGHGFIKGGKQQVEIPLVIINYNQNKNIKSLVESYRGQQGLLNTSSTYQILSELMGYSVPKEIKKIERNESYYIYHVNQIVYPYGKDI
ncbi:phosphoethanolamine transferase [Photorhabdus cinerea]|uniref:Sulfatase N-terminal domain-containing protein n=1 Tax=Photorhabdus cinerea TaxID=471575 RepID=A0A7X5QD25_9GAMM|nr:phosphoethanolamine transferase [Photorhabdus cinerea]NHB92022.1 hypothetical protein [Photorhabdus cinerea]